MQGQALMRKPLKDFCQEENISIRHAYDEKYAGRLIFTYVGRRAFITDDDAAAWRALAPRVTGKTSLTAA